MKKILYFVELNKNLCVRLITVIFKENRFRKNWKLKRKKNKEEEKILVNFTFVLLKRKLVKIIENINFAKMVVLDATSLGTTAALLGGPYAQGAPALKIIPKRYLGVHQWLSPIATKDLKEQIVSFFPIFWIWFYSFTYKTV